MNKITYTDKVYLSENVDIPATNKVRDVDMNEIKSVVNDNADESDTNFANLKGTILWTNPNPTSDFIGQTVSLNESLNNYDLYEIVFSQSKTASRLMTTGRIPVGYGTILHWNSGTDYYRATETTVTGSTITFEDGKAGSSTSNGNTIPVYVIGYKTGLFS